MHTTTRRFVALVVTAATLAASPALAADKPAFPLSPMNYRGVTLEGGRLGRQYDEVRRDYLAISNDALLKGFRTRAGRAAPGPDLGGWYPNGLFHIFGQVLSGLSRFYAGSGDEACREKANYLVHEWALCIGPDGFFFNTDKPVSSHYVYEKIVGGLVDNYVYCGNREALDGLRRITDWAIDEKRMSRNRHPWAMEWFTIGENLYRAYLATGDERYRDFARAWEYTDYWNLFTVAQASRLCSTGETPVPHPPGDIFVNPPLEAGKPISFHAYSHVNTFSSAAAAYEVTREQRYLDILRNAQAYLLEQQAFATGGYGPLERLMPRKELRDSLDNPFIPKHFETQCGSWAAFKLSKYLMRFTGEAKYGDWVERLTLNGIGASLPMSDGRVMYDSDYHSGGAKKVNTKDGWTCCAGTRQMAIADYADLVCFQDARNLYVNLFTPFTVRWPHDGGTVTLRQQTLFPESNETLFTVSVPRPMSFGLRIRKPAWLATAASATLNGGPVELQINDKGWFELDREWHDGDTLRLTLPMKLEWEPFDRGKDYPGAVRCGPVVLAIGSEGTNPGDAVKPTALAESLIQLGESPLHFRIAAAPALTARPFYEFREGERYFMYLDPAWSGRISSRDFDYHGKWVWGTSSEAGAWAECAFEGTTVAWLGRRGDDAGRAEVTLDGRKVAVVDQFTQSPDAQITWQQTGLPPGRHMLRITVLPDKTPASAPSLAARGRAGVGESKGNTINIAGLRVDRPPASQPSTAPASRSE